VALGTIAPKVEDLLVYKKADRAFQAICALIEGTDIRKNFKLRDQLQDAAGSVRRNISEGGGQQTDRMLIKYLCYSYGSAKEVRAELAEAFTLKYISQSGLSVHDRMYDEITAMLIGWIKYLRQSERKNRLIGGQVFEKNSSVEKNSSDPPPESG
jgi:four helix bundle protein